MGSMNVVGLFFQASFLVQCIMLILLGFSVVSWAVILQKSKALNKTKKEIISFNKKFWSLTELNSFYNELDKKNENIQGIEMIFYYGFKEFHRLYQINPNMANAALDGSLRMMKLSMNKELDSLEDNIPLLGTVGSISPYIGLFGTVWGIMHAFISLGEVKQATLQMVAPGIAEALIATAIGLFAAIPAVMAHNRLTLKVSQIEQSYSNFIEEFSTILQRQAIAVRT